MGYPPFTDEYAQTSVFVQTFIDGVKRSLDEHHDSLTWRRVTVPGLDVAWVGMHVPVVDTGGRPWVWEVVTPEQYGASHRMQDDPMVLPVSHDTVVAEVNHLDHSGPIMRMQVPVREAPSTISLANGPDSSGPWSVRLETGWTIQALGSAAQCWIDRETSGTARLTTPEPALPSHQRYQLHPAIDFESAAFDRLLTLDPDDAAVVTSLLSQVHDALLPFR